MEFILRLHQELGEAFVSCEVEVGKELLAFFVAVVFFGDGFFDFDYEVGFVEDLVGGVQDAGAGLFVLFVGEAGSCAGLSFDYYFVAVVDQLGDAVGLHANAAFHVLYLFGYAYYPGHRGSSFFV